MSDNVMSIAAKLGFSTEIMGGGCYCLSRYWLGGTRVWATAYDGAGLPDATDFLICAYPNEWDGSQLPVDCEWRSGENLTFQGALAAAIAKAESLLPSTDVLTAQYNSWLDEKLPSAARDELPENGKLSADELQAELYGMLDNDTSAEIAPLIEWLSDFSARWDEVQAIEDRNYA